jgi:hypothetical protein
MVSDPGNPIIIKQVMREELGHLIQPCHIHDCTKEEVDDYGNLMRQFVHIASSIGASEAEEVCVEHFLKDIKDSSQG